MFLPASFFSVILLGWLVGGALLGAVLGNLSAGLLHLDRRRPWRDAASGAVAVLLLAGLIVAITRGTTTQINGHTLGRRAIVLDHLIAWGFGMICLTVVSCQFFASFAGRRDEGVPLSR